MLVPAALIVGVPVNDSGPSVVTTPPWKFWPVITNVPVKETPALMGAGSGVGVTLVITGAGEVTVIVSVCEAVCGGVDESVTVTVNVELPAVVGVPLNAPVVPNVIPAGSVPLLTAKL